MRGCNTGENKPARRGRPRKRRFLNKDSQYRCFQPCCNPDTEGRVNVLEPEELEALRLVDLLDYDQETAAEHMGVSRKTLWRDLHEGRRKVVEVLVEGKRLEMSGCADSETEKCCCRNRGCRYTEDTSGEKQAKQ
ncbi:DUF134 domain-containing protein [Methanogenium marinum]|uniref:UPF0251 protein L0665_00725 n=1 Tax=Methanogenium marinum TaxID=348610 RepID=A0A9Q4PY32_9EURY|nr:DUF134 domain-containing protein [Methanogenium marinum]MDE4907152.1 DUF134 domain-containing protein [Methanogenium marinum]